FSALPLLLATGAAEAAASTRPILEALDVTAVPCLDRDGLGAQLRTWLRRDEIDNRISIVVRPATRESANGSISFFILRHRQPVGEPSLPRAAVGCDKLRAPVGRAIALSVETMPVEPQARPRDESVLDFVPAPPKRESDERRFSFSLWVLGAPALLPR